MATDIGLHVEDDQPLDATVAPLNAEEKADLPDDEQKLVLAIQAKIKEDKDAHKDAYATMRRDMYVVRHGHTKDYPVGHYKANLVGRHIKTKTASLYAKNPKIVAKRRETLDFKVWDENPESLMAAYQALQMAMQVVQPQVDQATGMEMPPPPIPPGAEEGLAQARAIVEDFMQGYQRRQIIGKLGRTLEILFNQATREQKPLEFKKALKKLVRRTLTTCVGYVELGFQRETGPRPAMVEKLADARVRLDHLARLQQEAAEGEIADIDQEMAELRLSVQALENEEEIVLREGLIFDYPSSTSVIPDKRCTDIDGFVGARHVTIEYMFSPAEVEEMFPGVDMTKLGGSKKDGADGAPTFEKAFSNQVEDDADDKPVTADKGLIRVWKTYDKPSGLVYYTAEGYKRWLRAPAAPDVFVEDFWPLYALTVNDVESDTSPFPPSDVTLILDMQMEYNRSRQGMREHRRARRPRWVGKKGMVDDEAVRKIAATEPFETVLIDMDPASKISDLLEEMPVPGVDPNLYETGQIFTDITLVVGSSEAQFGGVAQATATESAIAANSSASTDSASMDDLDSFLTCVARGSGQILLREMSTEKVMEIAGVGAVWPEMTLSDIANELALEVEAGSTGKPNQAVEINNWKQMMPLLMQVPGIKPMFLAKQSLKRLDDKLDITDALAESLPSIVSMNQMVQPAAAQPQNDPNAQGARGADNGLQPPRENGPPPGLGNNQV